MQCDLCEQVDVLVVLRELEPHVVRKLQVLRQLELRPVLKRTRIQVVVAAILLLVLGYF